MALCQAVSPPSSTFLYFPALPPELRLQIWHFALQTPRMITLHLKNPGDSSIYADPAVRPLLFVNVEARKAALASYLPGFYDICNDKIVWVNPTIDTLYLKKISVCLMVKYGIAKHVEHIALEIQDWEWFGDAHIRPYLWQQIALLCTEMPSLKTIELVTWDEREWHYVTKGEKFQTANALLDVERGSLSLDFFRWHVMRLRDKRLKAIEQFRGTIEETRCTLSFLQSQTAPLVQDIAFDAFGAKTTWDFDLEVLYHFWQYTPRSYHSRSWM